MNKKMFYIIAIIILAFIIIMLFTANKNKKAEPYIDYWCCTIENDIKIFCDLQKGGKGLYEYSIDDMYHIWYFDWKVKDDTVVVTGKSGTQIFKLNELDELECISGNINGMDIRGKYTN